MSELAEIRVPGDRHPAPFYRAVLDNGLTVLDKPTPALPSVAV
jgi:hypothetical protein